MENIRNVEPGKYNILLAEALKKEYEEFAEPEWVKFVKTGSHKQRPSIEVDFWHKRAASILRQIYVKKVVGVQRLRTRYGGRKNRGMRPDEFVKAGGKIIRTLLQQAEKAGLVEQVKKGKHFGRQLTKKGLEFMESVSK